jgi:phosphopantothenoylcysteine decarboxylase/phosphopantothenate--cysteine ligase
MGYAIAQAARRRGATVTLVSGPSSLQPPEGVTVVRVTTTAEMAKTALSHYPQSTIVIMAAAVSDFRPKSKTQQKMKKGNAQPSLPLEVTEDILKEMGKRKEGQFLVGFALETENIVENAFKKLEEKNLDLIIANDTAGLDSETNQISIIDKHKQVESLPPQLKEELADRILDAIERQ